ncbi:MAG: transglutaminase domain-containing protein [Phycisphaerales bacterium]|nr:MAG: transglutaminase domain-containing protein [Phycisphaerales bacterium]
MKMQKAIAVTMILTSSIQTALACGDIAYPALLCVLGLLGLQRRFTWEIRPERRVIKSFLLLFLAVMFALQFRYAGFSSRMAFDEAAAMAWQTITRYFLASMILILFLGSRRQLPASLGLFHIAVTISAGQVLLLDDLYVAFRLSELLSVLLVVFYATADRPSMQRCAPKERRLASHWLAYGLILLLALNGGWIMSSILYRHVEVLNYLPVWFGRGGAGLGSSSDGSAFVGFSNSGKLSSILQIKGEQDPTPVLSIRSDGNPGYLRAGAFDVYRESEWFGYAAHKQEILPQQTGPFGIYFAGRRNIFRLDVRDTSGLQFMTVQHETPLANTLFTPLGTSFLEAPFHLILRDENDIVYASNVRSDLNYRIAHGVSDYRKPPTSLQQHRMLGVPRNLDRRIVELAATIFSGCDTPAEKIEAVISHFNTHYSYSLGLDAPSDRDKLTYFLTEASTGYCEYFASGAAVLLRLAGVPTRYVTGFLVTEQNPQRDLWIARNMDAHAWVEAWDREKNQWTIVEATVGQEAAQAGVTEDLQRESGGARFLLSRLVQAVYEYGFLGVLSWFFQSYGLLAGISVSLPLFGAALALALVRRRHSRISQGKTRTAVAKSPALLSLHRMLARMDRRVTAAGAKRHLNETLYAFSDRLGARDSGDGLWQKISDWYRQYADLRYSRLTSPERVHELQRRAHGLRDAL